MVSNKTAIQVDAPGGCSSLTPPSTVHSFLAHLGVLWTSVLTSPVSPSPLDEQTPCNLLLKSISSIDHRYDILDGRVGPSQPAHALVGAWATVRLHHGPRVRPGLSSEMVIVDDSLRPAVWRMDPCDDRCVSRATSCKVSGQESNW